MKLYYTPGACSLAPHIVLREIGAEFSLEKVDLATGKTESGEDYRQVNPHGYVPALQLDNGEILTEVVVIMQYLADQSPESGLAPECGSFERVRLEERLNYLTSEFHKTFSPLFADTTDEEKHKAVANVKLRLDFLNGLLADRDYMMGENYSLADIYLFVIANWTHPTGIGLDDWPHIKAHAGRVASRETVQQAMKTEGLI